jgi:hypothetical protein
MSKHCKSNVINTTLDAQKRKIFLDFLNNYIEQLNGMKLSVTNLYNEQPALLKGMILLIVGKYKFAQRHFENALSSNQKSVLGWYGKAISQKKAKQGFRSIDCFS